MDQDTARWAWGFVIVGAFGLIGFVVTWLIARHGRHDDKEQDISERVAVVETELKAQGERLHKVEREIYDHDRGILDRLHAHGREIQELIGKLYLMMRGDK